MNLEVFSPQKVPVWPAFHHFPMRWELYPRGGTGTMELDSVDDVSYLAWQSRCFRLPLQQWHTSAMTFAILVLSSM
jgi:hypothetical protein